jgi:N-methylhydantoinase A
LPPTTANSTAPEYALGVDIGGTFTDLVAINLTDGSQDAFKTPTIPKNPAEGVANGLRLLADRGVDARRIKYFVHGTTVGLNAVIQRAGTRMALLVTEGFRDVLEIARLRVPHSIDFYSRRPAPLVSRDLVVPVRERMRADGSVEHPLTEDEIASVASRVRALRVEGIAICFLHAYRNAAHEQRMAAALREIAPDVFVSVSSEVWPQQREYERALVTVLNTFTHGVVSRYMESLESMLAARGVTTCPYITRSNGGVMTVEAAKTEPVHTLLSGPASGVMGALRVAADAGIDRIITLDVGGTSADVAVAHGGQAEVSEGEHVGDFPIITPAIGVSSIGAGGGSIAWLDGSGVLKVGPHSAGADPGPVCYGRGGTAPTVTDAFLVCGVLNPAMFAGGRQLDRDAAVASLERLGQALDLEPVAAGDAILRVALANMLTEMSGVYDRKGLDARDFTLVPFGGAGPLLGCLLAEEANIGQVLVPPSPGTLCALGALHADALSDFIASVRCRVEALGAPRYRQALEALRARSEAWLDRQAPAGAARAIEYFVDARYVGQSYEIKVPLADGRAGDVDDADLARRFHERHEQIYGHSDPSAPVEVINLRARAIGRMAHVVKPSAPHRRSAARTVHRGERRIFTKGTWRTAAVIARSSLHEGDRIEGPAIVEQADSTCLIPPGWAGAADAGGNLKLRFAT